MSVTPAQVEQDYLDYADYQTTGSIADARAFATACRRMLATRPTASAHGVGGRRIEMNIDVIAAELSKAEAWIESHADSDSVAHGSFTYFRD